jgi:hypothetical protein
MIVVFDRCIAKLGRGGLLETLFAPEPCLSTDRRSSNSSSAADNARASSFRSSVHDFALNLLLNASPMGSVTECCKGGGRGFRGDLGEPYCPFGITVGAFGRLACFGTFAECRFECEGAEGSPGCEGLRCGLGVVDREGWGEGRGDNRICPGIGDIGTFSKIASSGTSSSKSSYSASNCLTDFRPGCHDFRLVNGPALLGRGEAGSPDNLGVDREAII